MDDPEVLDHSLEAADVDLRKGEGAVTFVLIDRNGESGLTFASICASAN